MSIKSKTIGFFYQKLSKPVVFSIDAERVHDGITKVGESLEKRENLISWLFSSKNTGISKNVLDIKFENPIGLTAGFDYDGHLAKVVKYVGFGFNTVGTITAKPYEGNTKPRLLRLPKSRSLLVNKGFKSDGAIVVAKRLDKKNLDSHVIGISVGSTNLPEINTVSKAIDDYLFTFDLFKKKNYVKYFELNISCPNTALTESFTHEKNFKNLVKAVISLKIKQPIFVKMPNEIEFRDSNTLVETALKYGIRGFIFSNLVKDRNNPAFDKQEIKKLISFKGNFSGRPTFQNSNNLIARTRNKFGKDIAIIGCGGIFTPEDALAKFDAGADLVQLITGVIYQGPQLICEICKKLQHYLSS